jgi:hypothetical protein
MRVETNVVISLKAASQKNEMENINMDINGNCKLD